jgi:hypothetical protein
MDFFALINRPLKPITVEDFKTKKNPNYKNVNASGGIKIVEFN